MRVFLHQSLVFLDGRKLRIFVRCGRAGPGEFLAQVRFDEWGEAARVIQHRCADIHKIESAGLGEHPAHAVWAETMFGAAVQTTDDRLTLRNYERASRKGGAQGERAAGHALTAGAVTGHGEERRCCYLKSDLPAAAAAFLGYIWHVHVPSFIEWLD